MKGINKVVEKVFVINLEDDSIRRKHVKKQFKKKGIDYEIVNAVSSSDSIVKKYFKNNLVMSYPPCFRCKEGAGSNFFEDMECLHENNYLTPKQVANFLSFKKIMNLVVKENYKNILIFEDDFYFKKFSNLSFKYLLKYLNEHNYLKNSRPFLFRIGSHTKVNKKYYLNLLLNQHKIIENNYENMANPCFLINYQFAKLFLDELDTIYTTSDNFIHRILPLKYNILNFSIYPFPVGQHSYGGKSNKFNSTIFTNKNEYDFNNNLRVETLGHYNELLKEWMGN
jgi:GR25 family glycosyltransferase involved in LPS biosynthesis